ncbi:hypothetical protein ZIOFF_008088 [Zingiber officinale]|uniref:Cysteine protease n=1 Tax=Zingiber officinale TaxID=94328 RepID=A0A8J5HVM7_ZINOF|nr:hypothetical protein ZIOFF_008088 [Zingiber officinale]
MGSAAKRNYASEYLVCHEFERFSTYLSDVKVAAIFYGAVHILKHRHFENDCPHIVVGTSERVSSAFARDKDVSFKNVRHFTHDECDEMLESICGEMFRRYSRWLPMATSDVVHLFSATLSEEILFVCFEPIGDSKFTCDVNWGCMIRSSQMLIAQALILHYMGGSWRKPSQKPYDVQYIEILHLFGDSSLCTFSIHNLLKAGKAFGLAAGSWLGPYAMCRTWETIAHAHREQDEHGEHKQRLPMVLYVVSGDKDGEQGGAPVICIEVVSRRCHDFNKEQLDWAPILFLVPLVLGLEKINPRYIPLLRKTFTFPQSLGILGGKPGASTYIVGVQDEKALYLDPHEVQTAVDIKKDDLESDCTSYHCSTVRHLSLDMIDPSLAIGFYCRDKGDFEDFCSRATQLADKSGGAPLFTVAQNLPHSKPILHNDCSALGADINSSDDFYSENLINDQTQEDEWQIL